MKPRIKAALLALLSLLTIILTAGCGETITPYEKNNAENYTVSVKYDANGGIFTTNTSVIVDSYNIADITKNGNGMAEIALLPPDASARGTDAFTAIKNGYFLAGWYKNCQEAADAEGNPIYTYSDKWDFENDLLEVDPSKTYSSDKSVLTLYAAWVPLFEIEFYSLDSGEFLERFTFDPTSAEAVSVPKWDTETGKIQMFKFPERTGYTFDNVYYDKNRERPVDTETVLHPGVVNYETGTAENPVLQLYIDWKEGEWFRIHNADQFIDNASAVGNYEICADIDFEGREWSTLIHSNFTGTINGNGFSFRNINYTQSDAKKQNVGFFGQISDGAQINDLTFENLSFTVKTGTLVADASFGLLAGSISKNATLNNVEILNSRIMIDSACYFGVDNYSIGLICGSGDGSAIEIAEIECVATGENPESVNVTVDGNSVMLEFVTE